MIRDVMMTTGDTASLGTLSRTNKALYKIVTPTLYRTIQVSSAEAWESLVRCASLARSYKRHDNPFASTRLVKLSARVRSGALLVKGVWGGVNANSGFEPLLPAQHLQLASCLFTDDDQFVLGVGSERRNFFLPSFSGVKTGLQRVQESMNLRQVYVPPVPKNRALVSSVSQMVWKSKKDVERIIFHGREGFVLSRDTSSRQVKPWVTRSSINSHRDILTLLNSIGKPFGDAQSDPIPHLYIDGTVTEQDLQTYDEWADVLGRLAEITIQGGGHYDEVCDICKQLWY